MGASYQPQQPIAKLDSNMELSFTYFTGNSAFIYISFYNETQQDNYHYEWRNIIPHSWETTTIPLRWFTDNKQFGKTLNEGDIITKLNFYAGSPSQKPIV